MRRHCLSATTEFADIRKFLHKNSLCNIDTESYHNIKSYTHTYVCAYANFTLDSHSRNNFNGDYYFNSRTNSKGDSYSNSRTYSFACSHAYSTTAI